MLITLRLDGGYRGRVVSSAPFQGEAMIGHSLEGVPIIAPQFGDGKDTALLMEWVELNPGALGDQTLLVVSNANPDGIFRGERFNLNRVDLNRNFPAGNRVANKKCGKSALSEPEARALFDIIGKFQPAALFQSTSRSPEWTTTVRQPNLLPRCPRPVICRSSAWGRAPVRLVPIMAKP